MHINVKGNNVCIDVDEIEALAIIESLSKSLAFHRKFPVYNNTIGYNGPTILQHSGATIPAAITIVVEKTYI